MSTFRKVSDDQRKVIKRELKKIHSAKSCEDLVVLGIISSIVIKDRDVGFVLEVYGNIQISKRIE